MAAKIIPSAATAAYQGPNSPGWVALSALAVKAPSRHRNSPMNPLSPGSPTDESTKKTMKNAHTGILAERPDSFDMSRVW